MLRDRLGSIRNQVQLLAALSAATALAVACAAFTLNDLRVMMTSKQQQLYRYAAVVARNAGPEMAAESWEEADLHLGALRLEPTVTSACLYDPQGRVVAEYLRDEMFGDEFPEPGDSAWLQRTNDDQTQLFQPIHHRGQRVGSLYLQATNDDLHEQQANYPFIVGLVFTISLAVAATLAARMQRRISGPIDLLAKTAERVSSEGDYSVRVGERPLGQLGKLCAVFDAMLDRVETADRNLQEAHDKLNGRVRDRTRELHREVLERRHAESVASGQTRVLQLLASGAPLPEVLGALIGEVERHIGNTTVAISAVEANSEWFGDAIGLQISGQQREGLRQLPYSKLGAAPARAAVTLQPEFDLHNQRSAVVDASGFESTAHGGACWAIPVVTADGRLLAVLTLFYKHSREPNDDELGLLLSAGSLASLAIEQRNGEKAIKAAMHKATEANRSKSEFLANMSHEIRTPLNAILGFADLLLSDSNELDAERRGQIETISTSGKHLLELINDVLDLSKIEAVEVRVEKEPTDPNRVLAEVMSLLRVKAVQKGITLDCEWRTPAPTVVHTDGARLRQLLVNLVGNAVKFTEHGGVRVVAAIEAHGDDATLRLDVTDTGVGIAEDKLGEIFNPFVQADASVTRRFGGTGLGLAICRRLTEAMGGSISVTSKPGQGSCFTLRLPAGDLSGVASNSRPVCDAVDSHLTRSADSKSHGQVGLEGLRVLVVEDGETNRRLISLVLRRAGAEVEMANNGQEGVDAALACDFDAILMDMQMPVMDGYTAASRLREANYGGPIIALTAHAMMGDEQRCLDSGCSDYLTKPIEAPRLMAKLAALRGEIAVEAPVLEAAPESNEPIPSLLPTDDEEFCDVAAAFLAKYSDELARMAKLVDASDWQELRKVAHWFKGSGGTAGYTAVSNAARDLEDSLKGSPTIALVRVKIDALRQLRRRLVVKLDGVPA
ncbi:Sensory/regulatory protein RpfC [Botrimarina colliarenosi]|uniref:histidine kinase n=1 Tax=Botrimarina colliarenosi TaxID=2528001 RepID=A0A5C6A946_9BACT|nr:ATP-binding protein [Botrimarina colliarenosi]TWT96069.1 Sensory/regulatory protein RpfC [Botrimarina colliarenosi]